jgi:hypothetical protein
LEVGKGGKANEDELRHEGEVYTRYGSHT